MWANGGKTERTVQMSFPGLGAFKILPPNPAARIPIAKAAADMTVGALRLSTADPLNPAGIVAVLDIENESGLVTMGSRPAATEFSFPHVANGNGLFTGLAFATGGNATSITIEVYEASGGAPKSASISVGANQQLARLVSELVAGTATQLSGYIRIRADQPIWAWEIYGSGQVMASGPPL